MLSKGRMRWRCFVSFFAFDIAFHILFVDGNQDENGRERRDEVLKAAASVNDMEKSEKIGLDEITANLDAETEKAVLSALKWVAKDRTVISISHRTSAELGWTIQI